MRANWFKNQKHRLDITRSNYNLLGILLLTQRKLGDQIAELEAYDNIGLAYYYLNNIDKANYYHRRMMNGEFEGDTFAKQINLEFLRNCMKKHDYSFYSSTIFDTYNNLKSKFVLPHERINIKEELESKMNKLIRKIPLISPKYESNDLRERIFEKALVEIMERPRNSVEMESLQNLSKNFIKTTRQFRNRIAPLKEQYELERQRRSLYGNPIVCNFANK